MPRKPVTGWPDRVLDRVVDWASDLVDDPDVDMFYIGRTCDPTKRCDEHEADELVVIYETESDDNALDVETGLIAAFKDHPKCDNDSGHCGGNLARDSWHRVYIALWYADDR